MENGRSALAALFPVIILNFKGLPFSFILSFLFLVFGQSDPDRKKVFLFP
jgi:hypothetical protein